VVTRRCKHSVAVVVAFTVNILVLMYAAVRLFGDYSPVRWLFFDVAVLFSAVADIYDDLCSKFSSVVMYIVSTLTALKAAL
jgi:3'-phosphoadenosine 5'-phosphosulfate sulfotransferase (PAPS reductase)/FAD synthetase